MYKLAEKIKWESVDADVSKLGVWTHVMDALILEHRWALYADSVAKTSHNKLASQLHAQKQADYLSEVIYISISGLNFSSLIANPVVGEEREAPQS
jgi:hypothetical protein